MIRKTALALAAAVAFASSAHAQNAPDPGTPNISGVWMLEGDRSTIKTVDGKLPPMNKKAAAQYSAAIAARKAGKSTDPINQCLPHGIPRLLFSAYPIEVLQEKDQVTFVHEVNHTPRLVFLGAQLPPKDEQDQNWFGFSAGRWEGDTLVVETAGFNDITTIDRAGLPHSTDMVVGERIRLIDNGQRLEDVITVTDPQTFTKPWSTRVTFTRKPGYRLQQYVCTDNNPEASAK
jgi:hypothetical protein